MTKKSIKTIFLGLLVLFITSESYACYRGLDCPEDLPKSPKSQTVPEEWKKLDRYLVKGGLVKDPVTGVIWMRCSFGQTWEGDSCQGKPAKISWMQAQMIAENFEYAGYSDWAIGGVLELKRLVTCESEQSNTSDGCAIGYAGAPTIMQTVFPATPAVNFWTSSTINNDDAWIVNFATGSSNPDNKETYNAMRLMRKEPLFFMLHQSF